MTNRITSTASTPQVSCAIYTRKSTEKGLEQEFNSLHAQREACEAYIASQRHEGWIALTEHYDDPGFSGGTIERPGLQKLMRDIEHGKVDCVVFYKLDRLSRSLLDFVKLAEFFDRHNVTFVSITQQFSSTTAMGRLTLNILLSFAEFERAIIAERVRDKIAAAKKRGKYLGGTPTFGYNVDYQKKRLIVNSEEARIVRRVFKRFTETGSCLGIAKEINAEGISTKSWTTKNGSFHQGGQWNTSHVYRLLNNRTYLGETVHNGESYPGEHEAIISKLSWEKVQRIFAQGTSRKRNQETREVKALLRGIIRCAHCDRSMICVWTRKKGAGKVYRYYTCNGAIKNGYESCPVRSVPAGEIEKAVTDQLRAILRSPEMIAKTFRAAKELEDQELETLREEKSSLEMRLVELKASASELAISDAAGDTPSKRFVELNDDIHDVRQQLSDIGGQILNMQARSLTEQDVANSLRKLDPIWDELFPSEQHRIFRSLVESVVVTSEGIDIRLRADGIHSVVTELRNGETEVCAV
ncbi:MAG: recombinase family protein [Armatimonadetes bacterium]|jgi:site-specific DNA recombinase|nr:recombinase family protein [Armatimonadota bacterium]